MRQSTLIIRGWTGKPRFQDNVAGHPDITDKVERDVKSDQTNKSQRFKLSYFSIFGHKCSIESLRIPKGKRIWFWYKMAPAAMPVSSESARNLKSLNKVNKAGLFHIYCLD